MRLIDADELVKKFTNANASGINLVLDRYAVKCIEDAPTIAQPERKHGKWLLHSYMPHKNYCSCCETDSPYNNRWKFCPNCGADMMEVDDERPD